MKGAEVSNPGNLRPVKMLNLLKRLWPINRSITGAGYRESLEILEAYIGLEFTRIIFQSGEKVFDWEIPKEWNVNNAYIEDSQGRRYCEFGVNNLHLVGYSTPVDQTMSLDKLKLKMHSLPLQPDAIPYVTSYYEENWGFCISENERNSLPDGDYRAYINSELTNGELIVGELVLKGQYKEEVLISTYMCHPSMANNELSGPAVTAELIKFIASKVSLRYTYRFLVIPETIGSIAYLSKNLVYLKKNVIAGFNVTCVGDNRAYSFLPTRNGNTLSDKIAKHVLSHHAPQYKSYSWLDRGSDERQFCSPGIDLPIASIMRTKYGEYPEYHTSLDKIGDVVTPDGLEGGYLALQMAVEILERNYVYKTQTLGEPRLGKYGLYPSTSKKGNYPKDLKILSNVISYSDGKLDCVDIANILGVSALTVSEVSEQLTELGVLARIDSDE